MPVTVVHGYELVSVGHKVLLLCEPYMRENCEHDT